MEHKICNYELVTIDGLPIGGGYKEFAIVEFGKTIATFVAHHSKAVRRMEDILRDATLIIWDSKTGHWTTDFFTF